MSPTIIYTDVLVIGGGIAGVAAAYAAATEGTKVLVVEKAAYLGGKATAAQVGTVCGLYEYSIGQTPKFVVQGFARSFARQLQELSGLEPIVNEHHLACLPYRVNDFKTLCVQLLQEADVTVISGATVTALQQQEQLITQVAIQTADKLLYCFTKSVVDCSGDSVVASLLALPLIESNHYQAAAQVFTVSGITETNETRLSFSILKAISKAIHEQTVPDYFDRVYLVPGSLQNGMASFKVGIPLQVTYTPGNLQQLQQTASAFIAGLVSFLVTHVTACKHMQLLHLADELGIRTGVCTTGNYVLQANDILQSRHFEDAIANGSWPIEIWQQNKRVQMQYFAKDSYYQVPARCLQSAHIHNLFVGGRCISATDEAIASARVMGICLQTGYAAGTLAAGHVQDIPLEQSIQQLQNQQLKTLFSQHETIPGI